MTRATGREDQPGSDHPAYAEEWEDDGHREDRIYDAWKDQDINGD